MRKTIIAIVMLTIVTVFAQPVVNEYEHINPGRLSQRVGQPKQWIWPSADASAIEIVAIDAPDGCIASVVDSNVVVNYTPVTTGLQTVVLTIRSYAATSVVDDWTGEAIYWDQNYSIDFVVYDVSDAPFMIGFGDVMSDMSDSQTLMPL